MLFIKARAVTLTEWCLSYRHYGMAAAARASDTMDAMNEEAERIMQDDLAERAIPAEEKEPIEGSAQRDELASSIPEEAPPAGFLARIIARLAAIFPWASLVLSLASAFMMKREQADARLIAVVAALAFVGMLAMSLALSAIERHSARGWIKDLARFSLTALNQNILQLCLYFALPFYLASAAFTFAQTIFIGLLLLSALIVSWDPFCERALESGLFRPVLTAFVSFAALAMVFPMLGVAQGTSLYLAAFIVAILTPLSRYLELGRERFPVYTAAISAAFPILLFLGFAKAIPPAPLSLSSFGIGAGVEARELIGEAKRFDAGTRRLFCYSAIVAPLGLKEEFEHVWTIGERQSPPIVLSVSGGRKEGFRTWSRHQLPPAFTGKISCEVRTRGGQILGKKTVKIQ